MENRAERKRQKRQEAKAGRTFEGLTKAQLNAAGARLDALVDEHEEDPSTLFAVLLDDWEAAEHTRLAIEAQYQRMGHLKHLGRNVDFEQTKRRYAELLQEQELIEGQLSDVLMNEDAAEARGYLYRRHVVAHKGWTWPVRDYLATRLAKAAGLDLDGSAPSPEDAPGEGAAREGG